MDLFAVELMLSDSFERLMLALNRKTVVHLSFRMRSDQRHPVGLQTKSFVPKMEILRCHQLMRQQLAKWNTLKLCKLCNRFCRLYYFVKNSGKRGNAHIKSSISRCEQYETASKNQCGNCQRCKNLLKIINYTNTERITFNIYYFLNSFLIFFRKYGL